MHDCAPRHLRLKPHGVRPTGRINACVFDLIKKTHLIRAQQQGCMGRFVLIEERIGCGPRELVLQLGDALGESSDVVLKLQHIRHLALPRLLRRNPIPLPSRLLGCPRGSFSGRGALVADSPRARTGCTRGRPGTRASERGHPLWSVGRFQVDPQHKRRSRSHSARARSMAGRGPRRGWQGQIRLPG